MGRDKRNERRSEHFTMMIRNMMEEPAWKALSSTSQALYPWLRLEWHGVANNNNGNIRLSVRQAKDCLGVKNPDTAARAFHDLQAKGFIVVTRLARLGVGGSATSPTYELTELKMPKSNGDGRKLYRQWRPDEDLPVQMSLANNPKGKNGKVSNASKSGIPSQQ